MVDTQDSDPKVVTSKRDSVIERLRKRHPEQEYADDEALYGQIDADYDEYEKAAADNEEQNKRLLDTFANNPHSAQFLTDMVNGTDPWCGLIERIGIDGVTDLFNDPEKRKAFAEANSKFQERIAKEKELEAEYEKNMDESIPVMEQLQQERSLSYDQIDAAADFLKKITNEIILGKYTRESLELALKAINHDNDVAVAAREGEIRGRNAKVEERLRRPKEGDGLPVLGGAGTTPPSSSGEEEDIFSLARQARTGVSRQ